jgi:hypothetical protein
VIVTYQADGTPYSKREEDRNNQDLGCPFGFEELHEETSVVDGCIRVTAAGGRTTHGERTVTLWALILGENENCVGS